MTEHISAAEWAKLNEVVKTIHAVDLDALPGTVVSRLKDIVAFSHSMYHYSITVNGSTDAFAYRSDDLPQEELDRYQRDFESIDYINWFADDPTPHVFRDTDLVPKDFRESSEFMRKWMRPNGLFYSIGMTIAASGCPYANIFLFRSQEEEDFSDVDVEMLSVLNEHLCIRYRRELPHGHADKVVSSSANPLAQRYHLTPKESDVLACIADGRTRASIPAHLFISENTFKKHLANIYKKTGATRYEDLVILVRG